MGKTIVFCADGTWNGPGNGDQDADDRDATNVERLFDALAGQPAPDDEDLQKEREKLLGGERPQAAKYIHGVGDSTNPIVSLVGGTFGAGIVSRIVRGYTFVSRHFAPGDAIVLTGFSRGAFTARALGGLIAKMGVLDQARLPPGDKEAAYRAGVAAWLEYRRAARAGDATWLQRLDAFAGDLPELFGRPPTPHYVDVGQIQAIGVWDTVGSLGIPPSLRPFGDSDAFRFADTALSPKVRFGFHAVSYDEERVDFEPTLWDPREGVQQTLFPGAHSDVGGGYEPYKDDTGVLSSCALAWMIERLAAVGVQFATDPPPPSPRAAAHRPWKHPPFNVAGHRRRSFPLGGMVVSAAIGERAAAGPVVADPGDPPEPYRPP